MKTLIFITLKILEIVGAVAAYFLLAFIGHLIALYILQANTEEYAIFGFINFMLGLIGIGVPVMVIGLISVLLSDLFPLWIDKNKEWTRNIYNKLKR